MTLNRPLLLLAVIAVGLAGRDFVTRVYVGRDDNARRFAAPVVRPVPPVPNAANVSARLAGWLPAVGGRAGGAEPNDGAAWNLRLTGIFTLKGQQFAVIASTPKGGGPTERTQLAVGEAVKGYQLRDIGRREVTLEGADGTRRLVMFERTHKT